MGYPKRKTIKGNELFDAIIDSFCTNLINTVNSILTEENAETNVHLCAISRKTPRLLDLLRPKLSSIWDKLNIFTEIAIPFIDWSKIDTIILVDDAIYFGSTFSHYYNLLKSYNEHINIIPICCIKASEASLSFESKLKTRVHPRVDGHYFVKSLAEHFCEKYIPFEIEFPAFKIDLPNNSAQNITKFYNELCQKSNKKVYKITEIEIDRENQGCFEFGWNFIFNNDSSRLSKFRFYMCGSRLIISSITAYDISQQDLDNMYWKNNKCQELWDIVKDDIDILYYYKTKDYAYYRVLCIWYNYICSILSLLKRKNIIINILQNIYDVTDIRLNVLDETLGQIIGKDNAERAKEIISSLLSSSNIGKVQIPSNSFAKLYKNQEFLPSKLKYKDYYHAMQKKYINQCQGYLNEELACLVYLQSVMIDKMNRDFVFLDNERLKYGHTFSSIIHTISLYNKIADSDLLKIHAWIDKYIDRAAIVPQYIAVNTENIGNIWIRTMRSGENELDFIGNWCRLFLYILNKWLIHVGYYKLERRLFENTMSWIFDRFSLNDYCEENLHIKYKDLSFQLCIKENGDYIPVTERMRRLSLIDFNTKTDTYISINENLLYPELKEGVVLPKQLAEDIWNSLKSLLNLDNENKDSFPTYLFFNLYFKNHQQGAIGLQKQSNMNISVRVKTFIEDIMNADLEISDKIILEIEDLYLCYFRDQYNKIGLEKKADDIPIEEDKLLTYTKELDKNILKSSGKVFLDIIMDVLFNKDIIAVKDRIKDDPMLSRISKMIENCEKEDVANPKILLEQILKSDITDELFDR